MRDCLTAGEWVTFFTDAFGEMPLTLVGGWIAVAYTVRYLKLHIVLN